MIVSVIDIDSRSPEGSVTVITAMVDKDEMSGEGGVVWPPKRKDGVAAVWPVEFVSVTAVVIVEEVNELE